VDAVRPMRINLRDGTYALEGFWLHQTIEHHGPIDVTGVEGLDHINPAGISFAVQMVVKPK